MTKTYMIMAFKPDEDGLFETSRETKFMIVAIFYFVVMSFKYPDVDIVSRRPWKH